MHRMQDGRTDRSAAPNEQRKWMHRSASCGLQSPYSTWEWVDPDWIGSSCSRELDSEVNGLGLVPVHKTEIYSWADLTNLIANALGKQRRLRIIEDDTFLVIEPARGLVDLRHNGVQSEGKDSIPESPMGSVKRLTLPHEYIDDCSNLCAVPGAWRDNCCSLSLTIGDIAGGALGEEGVKLLAWHG